MENTVSKFLFELTFIGDVPKPIKLDTMTFN